MAWEDDLRKRFGSTTERVGSPQHQSLREPKDLEKVDDPIKFVSKGWGYEKWIVNFPLYCGKILFFAQGKKCSWHYHRKKDEVFYVQSGAVEVTFGWDDDINKADSLLLTEGEKFHVPAGLRHQMFALKDTELFEFSTEHFDEDSYRIIQGD